jgi:transcription termination/antitermination protein NusA
MSIVRDAFMQLARERNISPDVLKDALETAILAAYKRDPNTPENAEVEWDLNTGIWKVYAHRVITEDAPGDLINEISLEDAIAFRDDAQVDETIRFDVTPKDFGRTATQVAKQVINQKIRDAEKKLLFDEYKDREGTSIIGTVSRLEGKNIFINIGKMEAILPGSEQIHHERYRLGDRIKIFVSEVRLAPRGVQVVASRIHDGLVRELFELEVPEVIEGSVVIEGIAREAGQRTKIAVRSKDPGHFK